MLVAATALRRDTAMLLLAIAVVVRMKMMSLVLLLNGWDRSYSIQLLANV